MSEAPVLSRRSLADQAVETLRVRIAEGEWPVGAKIPTEPELVATLGIGRNAVREAVRALVHAGLLETRQGDGTYVRATSELAGAMRRQALRARLAELFEVRRAVEVEAAALAARRRTAKDLKAMESLIARRAERWAAGDMEAYVEADVAFHRAVAAASRNTILTELYDSLAPTLREAVVEADSDTADDHDALLAAIRDRDPARARLETARYLDACAPDR